MSWRRRWVVLVPGDVTWVERRALELLEEHDDGLEHDFMVIPGQGRYHSIVEKGHQDIGQEILLGRLFSLECKEPVYAIEGVEEFPCILRFLQGERADVEEQGPADLVRSLGCTLPWLEEPPLKPWKRSTRTVVLIQGLSATRVLDALARKAGHPLPAGYYRLEDGPRGLLLTDGTGEVLFEGADLSQRFPLATVYSVTATPSLDFFAVSVMRKGKTEKFSSPSKKDTLFPVLHEILGEREPERILAALGIPKEWFKL